MNANAARGTCAVCGRYVQTYTPKNNPKMVPLAHGHMAWVRTRSQCDPDWNWCPGSNKGVLNPHVLASA